MSDYLNKNFYINFFTIIIIFSLDRISKFYVISQNENNFTPDLFTSKYLNISLIWNEGIAFGLLSFNESHFYNLLTILIAIIIIVIFFMILRNKSLKKY
jgi:signal peptidase II